LLKLGYVTAGLVVGMGLSTQSEEWVVAKLAGVGHASSGNIEEELGGSNATNSLGIAP
jgi:hypothetical protein